MTLVCLALLVAVTSCGSPSRSPETPVNSAPAAAPASSGKTLSPAALLDKVKFKREDGSEALSVKPRDNGAKVVDGAENELVRLTIDGNKIKLKDAEDEVLGYVVVDSSKLKLTNADRSTDLFVVRLQEDGDYKLESGTDEFIYRIKQRDYGYEIESPDDRSLYKVKIKDGKLSLRDASDRTILSTRDELSPVAMTAFGFEVMSPEQQAAIAYALHLAGN
ncbi:MAG: hypothetical protein AAFX40_19625 [Cyanobacteria bacterium J06639_1]